MNTFTTHTATFYEVTVEHTEADEDGIDTAIKTILAVGAINFSEAETKALRQVDAPDAEAVRITPAPYKQVYCCDTDITHEVGFHRAVVVYTAIDEVTGRKHRYRIQYLIQADDMQQAFTRLRDMIKDSVIDHSAVSVSKSPVSYIIP